MRSLCVVSAVLLSLGWMGCGGDDDDDGEGMMVDCSEGRPDYEDVEAFDTCVNCHDSSKMGSARNGAEDNVNFDTEADADKAAEEAAGEVMEGKMPPKGAGTLTSAQKEQLYKWALCD